MTKEHQYKLYWVIALLIMIILFMFTCEKEPSVIEECGETHSVTYDTVRKTHIDTIQFVDTVKHYIAIEVPTPVYDTIRELNIYTAEFDDSLISGTVVSEVDGVLVHQDFNYTPKFPKYIMQYDSIFVTETVTKVLPKKRELYMGLYAGGNVNTFNLTPVITFKDKKDRMFSYGYNVIDNSHNVGFQTKIKLK